MTKTVQKTITMPCETRCLVETRALLDEVLAAGQISKHDKEMIILAVDEALSSLVTYARYKGTRQDISVSIDINDVRFKAVIEDSHNVFDMNGGMTDPARVAKERSFTMGIFLMRQVMDEVLYTYRKGFENQLELIKFL